MTDVNDASSDDATPDKPTETDDLAQTQESEASKPVSDEPSETDAETDEDSDNALAAAKSEAEKYRDMALRAEAEMQNLRRRSERDVQNAHKFGAERLIQNLLPVVDSLEKAVEASQQAETAEDDPQLEGLKLCLKLFTDVLTKEGIEVVDPLGQPFDPNVHEALSMIENPDMEPNSVMAVIQKGYRLHERLVRPAMVMVSKAPAGA
ncbi:MAG: nucleotide exchange factor GrpE [Gammaproteobacteria bacterium TMED95]|nr:nucleotide exchange factor GrpE [Gammaproteobacteria bacterium]OUV20323.1 MAG: nucleotide exchange factor GrpE [Gammaproteobacteria bacterium TMED95]